MPDNETIRYVLKQMTKGEGLWTSEPFNARTQRHVSQAVIAGWLIGEARWAETLEGAFLYGLDAKGNQITAAPEVKG